MNALDVFLLRALRGTDSFIPPSELAHRLRTSVETVMQRVAELRAVGFTIDERPGIGYRLLDSPDRIIADDLYARLGDSRFVREIVVFAETDSTNERLLAVGRSGAAHGRAMFAERQTAGRGRFGRRWESASHLGLWFSLLLRPNFPFAQWPRLTTWAAVAVAAGIEQMGVRPAMVKWPNDILIDDRKVAGILLETGLDGTGEMFVVVGVGVNVNHELSDFPPEIADRAGSLRTARGRMLDRAALAVAILQEMERRYVTVAEDFASIIRETQDRSSLLGKRIEVRAGETIFAGTAEALNEDGCLLLRSDEGEVRALTAGEVTLSC